MQLTPAVNRSRSRIEAVWFGVLKEIEVTAFRGNTVHTCSEQADGQTDGDMGTYRQTCRHTVSVMIIAGRFGPTKTLNTVDLSF